MTGPVATLASAGVVRAEPAVPCCGPAGFELTCLLANAADGLRAIGVFAFYFVTAQEGGHLKARKQESSFFEKKEAKKLFSGPAAPPEALTEPIGVAAQGLPDNNEYQNKSFFASFFQKKKILPSCASPDLGSYVIFPVAGLSDRWREQ